MYFCNDAVWLDVATDLPPLPAEEGAFYQNLIAINNTEHLRHTWHRRKGTTRSCRGNVLASQTDGTRNNLSEGSV